MRRMILFGILSVVLLSMVWPASANLVGTAGVIPTPISEPTPTPTPTPVPVATISPGPLVLSGNMASGKAPSLVDSSNVLDPITAATLNNAMSMFWQPASSSGISPLQAITSYDVSGLTMSPVEPFLGNAVGSIPFNAILSGDMDRMFTGA